MHPKYSIIIPVYNRPQEVAELLESLSIQTYKNFEVILVEDGSTVTSAKVYEQYADRITIRYFFKPNSGPGPSRNFGFEKAQGDYFVVLDSDCILPPHYFESTENFLKENPLDAWGGPDRGRKDFTNLQRAMAFTMSSVLTTGGIRGAKASGFQPRSFNMTMSRAVYEKTKGFRFDRFAEDIELSIRIRKEGFRTGLIPDAFVYHKRRTTFAQFYKQVSGFGKGRILVGRAHAGEVKLTHWLPAFFLIGLFMIPLLLIVYLPLGILAAAGYIIYSLAVAADAWTKTRSLAVSFLSIPSLYVQMTGYGRGFLREWWKRA